MLAREGVRVVVHGRSEERAQAVAAEIGATGGRAATALGDLTVDAELEDVASAAGAVFDGIDILVDNAGGTEVEARNGWLETPAETWLDGYRQNALPAVRLAQFFAPRMRERGWGRVIQISSRHADMPDPEFGPYGAAKAALGNLTVSLARALAGSGVTANTVAASLVWTPLAATWFKQMARERGSQDAGSARSTRSRSCCASPCSASADRRTWPPPSASWPARSPTTSPEVRCAWTAARTPRSELR